MTSEPTVAELIHEDWESGEPERIARAARMTAAQLLSRPEPAREEAWALIRCADTLTTLTEAIEEARERIRPDDQPLTTAILNDLDAIFDTVVPRAPGSVDA